MKSVLTVISDESLMSKFRIALSDSSIKYYSTTNVEEALRIVDDNEIAVTIMDYKLPVLSGIEMCESLIDSNARMQIIVVFDEEDAGSVINLYNKFHLCKLICKQFLVLEDIPKLIDSALYKYNRNDEIKIKETSFTKLSDRFMKPLHEISDVLNERMAGYQEIIHNYCECVKFVNKDSDEKLKSLNSFVDRIINDYIQLYMVRMPDYKAYLVNLTKAFNHPDNKKYFKLIGEDVELNESVIKAVLLMIDCLTISFDSFFSAYRGKIIITPKENYVVVNSLYEIRTREDCYDSDKILKINEKIFERFTDRLQFARKDNTIQYKAVINITSENKLESVTDNITGSGGEDINGQS